MILHLRTAGATDVEGIVQLLDACFATTGAGLGQRFTSEQVASFMASMPCVVAIANGAVAGVLIAQPIPAGAEAGAITRAMLDAFPPGHGSYIYGPIAVAPTARGLGIARQLADHLLASLTGRTGILFIDERNTNSLRTHSRLNFRRLGSFAFNGLPFACMAFAAP